jgi:hypothetical protein
MFGAGWLLRVFNMVEIAIDKGIFRDSVSMDVVANFFSERGTNLQSYKLPDDVVINPFACARYDFPDIKIVEDLIKKLQNRNPYAKPNIFISTYGEWQPMVQEDKKSVPNVVQNITAESIGQIAGHDLTINNQYLEPQKYLSILEQAIQEDPKFLAASTEDKESLLSKIKAIKNNPWIVSLGTEAIIEGGKKFFGL